MQTDIAINAGVIEGFFGSGDYVFDPQCLTV